METQRSRPRGSQYYVALLGPAIVAGVMEVTWPFFAQSPVSPFLLAITFSSWYGGLVPSLVSVAVSFLIADYFFVEPFFALWPPRRGDLVYLVTLVTVGSAISALSELMHRARRRAESSLLSTKRAEERARLVVEAAPSAMLMVSQAGRITLVNEQAEQLFGYRRDELLDQPIELLIPKRYRSGHPALRAAFSQHPTTRAMGAGRDLYGLRKDGSEVPIEIGLNPIRANEGEFVLASIIDITERKRAEERFRLVVEAAPNAMLMVSEDGLINLVNQQAEHLFGYERAQLLDQPIEMLVPERFRSQHPGHRQIFAQHATTRSMGAGRELYGLRQDGSEVPIEIGLNPIQTQEGAFVLASIIDVSERKRSEQTFRQIIERAPYGKLLVDKAGKITLVNARVEDFFGYTREELMGRSIDILVPPRFRHHHADYREVFTGNPVARSMGAGRDLFGLRKDGSEFPIEIGLNPLETEQGMKVLCTIVDITERKRAEEARRASDERYRTLFDCSPDGIVIANTESYYLDANSTMCRMLGYTRKELIGKHASDIVTAAEIPFIGKALDVIKSKSDYHREWQFRRKDGSAFAAEVIATLMPDGNLLAVIRDITERKEAESAVRQSEDRLDFALQVSETGAWDLDLVNHAAYRSLQHDRIFGYQTLQPEWSYEIFLDHVLAEDRQKVDECFGQSIAAKTDWNFECRIARGDGETRWIWASGRHRLDEHGVARRMSGIVQDITERKQAELEISKLNEELEQRVADRTAQLQSVNKELEAFSYSVSHDLRAPLRHINGFSQALLEDYDDKLDDTGKGYLREVRGASQEMAQLIDDVLQLARVTRSEMRREVVNLSELAHSIVAELQAGDVNRTVAVVIEEGLSARGDKRLLRIMLSNLIGNAWKFTSKQEQAEIGFGQDVKNAEHFYFIRDNGAGFDMTYVAKLFGTFQRLHTAGEFEGTGIGLATVQRIVHRHGGRVWAEGAANYGATFYFTLADFKESKHGEQSDLVG